MDINVNINGLDEPLSTQQQRNLNNAVRSTVIKTIREEKDSKNQSKFVVLLHETPTLFQAFLATTYGTMIFLFTVALIAIPAAAMGGALYVSNQQSAPIYRLTDDTNAPTKTPNITAPAKDTIHSAN